jgi:hypothetical protein
MTVPFGSEPARPGGESLVQDAESALRRLGYSRVPPRSHAGPSEGPQFWVQEPGVPRRMYPVFVGDRPHDRPLPEGADRPAIVVVTDPAEADRAWRELRSGRRTRADPETSILVLRRERAGGAEAHWHTGVVERRALLDLATGVIVGLVKRASEEGGAGQVDFEEMLQILKTRFHIDVAATLGVEADEEMLWMMFQLAQRYSFAPGDASSNLHILVLKPTGPAARLPWFAA